MAVISKTDAISVLSLQSIAANGWVKSADIDVSSKFAMALHLWFGRRSATAAGAGVKFRLESSTEPSGDGFWSPLNPGYLTDFVAAEAEAVSGTASAGQPTLNVASTTNLVVGGIVFIDNTMIANSEWGRIKSLVLNTSITLEDNLLNAQTGSTIYTRAEIPPPIILPLDPVKRLRLVVDGLAFTQAFAVRARMIRTDSIG